MGAKRAQQEVVEDFNESLRPYWEAVDPAAFESYVPRYIGGYRDLDAAVHWLRLGNNLGLRGDTGTGKSHFVHALASYLGEIEGLGHPWPVVTVSGSQGITEEDLFGATVATPDGLVQVPGPVELVARHGGLLFLDELNYAPPAVIGALNPLLAREGMFLNTRVAVPDDNGGWRFAVTKRHKRCYVVAAWNEGYRGTRELNEALLNRFRIWEWDWSPDIELALIASRHLVEWAQRARRSRREGLIDSLVSTTLLLRFEAALYDFGWDYAVEELFQAISSADRSILRKVWDDGFAQKIISEYGVA